MGLGLARIAGAVAGASPVFFAAEYFTGHYTALPRPSRAAELLVFLALMTGASIGALCGDYLFRKSGRGEPDYDDGPEQGERRA